MHTQPTARAERYERLLTERIQAGRRLMDAICHPDLPREILEQAWRTMIGLDMRLARFRRYSADYLRLLMPAEDARWHTPPTVPADHLAEPCTWCLHEVLRLSPAVALVPAARRAAR